MAFVSFDIDKAHISEGFAYAPYRVEDFPIGSCVVNKNGFNCLSFTNGQGAKFTDKKTAEELCNRWNS